MTRPARVAASTISMFSALPLDLAENRIQRVLQRAVKRIPLRRPQLFEIGEHALAAVGAAVRAAEIPGHIFASEDGLGEIVRNHASA